MIKRLRWKFVGVSMALITVLLTVILCVVCYAIGQQKEHRAIAALQAVDADIKAPAQPGDRGHGVINPEDRSCFVLMQNPQGGIDAYGGEKYDLTDTQLLQEIFAAARRSGKKTGILKKFGLRFYRLNGGPGLRYAFRDISEDVAAMKQIIFNCFIVGAAALVLFFLLMFWLARWMVKPVEQAWEQQRQFVADASHELKTPLTVIMTNAELLQGAEYDAAAKQRFAGSIQTMSRQMRGLVEGLLDLARLDHGAARKQMTQVELSGLVEEATLLFEAVYYEAGLVLESQIGTDLKMLGIEAQLRQVVEILVDNGRKYAAAGSTVRLKLAASGYGRVQLRVASRGETLTARQCKDIFKRFYRVDAARKMNHSYGLGLSIAQSIVQAHRGKIWCESKDGINTFYVNLPTRN